MWGVVRAHPRARKSNKKRDAARVYCVSVLKKKRARGIQGERASWYFKDVSPCRQTENGVLLFFAWERSLKAPRPIHFDQARPVWRLVPTTPVVVVFSNSWFIAIRPHSSCCSPARHSIISPSGVWLYLVIHTQGQAEPVLEKQSKKIHRILRNP
jgi:hypothetical protein